MYNLYHPLRSFEEGEDYVEVVESEGIILKDSRGKEYKDFISGLWNMPLGYSNEKVKNSIKDQLDRLPYVNLFNLSNDIDKKLAEKLYLMTDKEFVKTIYTCTGSESIEVAIKLAHKYQYILGNKDKKNIAVLDMSYHGTYYGSMSVSGMDYPFVKEGYGQIFNNIKYLKTPMCRCCKTEDIKDSCMKEFMSDLELFIEENGDELAAFLLEPILGSAGVIPIPKQYMNRIKQVCEEKDILLIFDEVATGFARTGSMFAYELYGVKPDIMLLSKGINNGYIPMGAALINDKVNKVMSSVEEPFFHLSTQNGNPLGCASALASIEIYEEENYCEIVREKGEKFKEMLINKLEKYPSVFEIRQVGFMFAIELSKSKTERLKIDDFRIEELIKKLVYKGTLIYGYYTSISSGLTLMPSFITTEEEWLAGIKDIENAIKRVAIS